LAASDPEEKRLRRLTPGELADEAGAHKTALARIKDEAIRREPRRAEGIQFKMSLSPPSRGMRLDRAALEAEIGTAVIARFSYETDTDWRRLAVSSMLQYLDQTSGPQLVKSNGNARSPLDAR
jgi:hypothetical protein